MPYSEQVPAFIAAAGETAVRRYCEFFTANIRNAGTRLAYANAVEQFGAFCLAHGVRLEQVTPIVVATYIEQSRRALSDPTVKLHLSAIRMLFDYLVVGQIVPFNPAAAVRGPKHVVKKGKTPVLTAEETRQLLDSIATDSMIGLRDRALIGVMLYSFARVSAVIGMNIEDYYPQGRRMWFRLHEKGGKHHEVPAHHKVEEYMDAYLEAIEPINAKKTPLLSPRWV